MHRHILSGITQQETCKNVFSLQICLTVNLADIAQHRLINQQLTGTAFKHVNEMVAWFGAMQAQEYAQAKWAMGLRLPHLKEKDIEDAFTKGSLIRTHMLRPTWHAVAAEDLRWMLKISAPRVEAFNAYIYRQTELDRKVFNRCNKLIEKTLEGGKHATRNAINEVFKKNKIEASGTRLSGIMMQAELDGLICSGARAGNQFTYALLEERIPPVPDKHEEEALTELTRKYFFSRGPATVKDFATWSGLTLTACKKGVAEIKELLHEVRMADEVFYFAGDPPSKPLSNGHLRLLPIYDELMMGYKDRSAFIPDKFDAVSSSFVFDNTIILNSRIAGTWRRDIGKKSIELEYDFFKAPGASQLRAFRQQVQQFETFSGLKVEHKQVPLTSVKRSQK